MLGFAEVAIVDNRSRFIDEQRRHHSRIAHANELENEE